MNSLRWTVFLLLVVAAAPGHAASYSTPNAPLIGSAWYPEQWSESAWDADLTLMEQAHFNVVRVGEFAWSTMEPSEGHYEFAWLDHAIALAARHHIRVVIGTPTDAPPVWLTTKYPETLRVGENGMRAEHGGRRQFNYASPIYRQFCAEIATQLGRRYGHNPDVIGWQIDNEYTDESFDAATRTQFQQFLRARYKTLANLNNQWTTAYWSETYSAWSQIPMESKSGNPGLLLDHKHFVTATWRSFQKNQIDALRPLIAPAQFITTNIGGLGWSDNWDHYDMTADLDLASWDDYVGQGHLDAPKNAMLNDFVRGWKRENFWVMETEPGSVNWAPVNNALAPGETRALAWQAVGHGADAVLYWQWRPSLNGQEQYHGTIVGPDGKPQPIYAELQQLGAEFEAVRRDLQGTSPHAEIALLQTYDSRWAIDFQPHTREYDQEQVLLRFYTPLQRMAEAHGEAVDIVDPAKGSLAGYKLLVAPSLNVIDEALTDKLLAWVRNGGHLLLGPRSGMKNAYNALNPERQPGPLAPALGAKVEQYYTLDHRVGLRSENGLTTSTSAGDIWAESLIQSSDTATDIAYVDPGGWLDRKAAMVTRRIGKGSISYLGTLPDAATLREILLRTADENEQSPTSLPSGTELCERSNADGSRRVLILINHTDTSAHVAMAGHFQDLLHQAVLTLTTSPRAETSTKITLPAQGVSVLIPEKTP